MYLTQDNAGFGERVSDLTVGEIAEVSGGPLPVAAVFVAKAIGYGIAAAAGTAAGVAVVKAATELAKAIDD